MSFLRRHYYERAAGGAAVCSYMMQGAISIRTVSEDFDIYPALAGRSMEDTGVLEWREPVAEIEDGFARAYTVTVADGVPVFDFNPPALPEPEPSPDSEEMRAALEVLGVDTTGGNEP